MSKLGKILFYIAFAGAIAALIAGGLLIEKRGEDQALLKQTQDAKLASDKAAAQAKQETATVTAAKADSDSKLAAATSKVDDLNTQLTTAQKATTDATAAVATANAAAKTAQDALDAINKSLNGETPAQYLADKTKAEADLVAAQSEQKILQDQLQAAQGKVADMIDAINRAKTGTMPGVSGKVTFVDRTWNFVVLDVGLSNGVVPNGELIVYRGRTFLGKIRVTKADPNDAVAEILPDLKGDIQVGDSVLN
jgi:NADH dehydrogenase/NADH:ubiquinone oxidoreductase subunit G